LKKSSAEFDVGIENGVGMEREPEVVDRITGTQRGQEIRVGEKGRMFCGLARRQEY
jgi:hypothetical protein